MTVLSWMALLTGLVVTAIGLRLPDRVRSPWDGVVAFLAPLGLAVALLGVLLICVPDFFESSTDEAGTSRRANDPRSLPGESP